MSETTTAQHQDPSLEHADLLQELTAPRREVVAAALRNSVRSGWPASRESVQSLIAYAQGRITSKEYAAQVLVALGYTDAQTSAALVAPSSQPAASPLDSTSDFDFLFDR